MNTAESIRKKSAQDKIFDCDFVSRCQGLRVFPFAASLLSLAATGSHILPVPRLVEVRSKAEATCVRHQPSINRSAGLDRPILIFGVYGLAADIDIECAPGCVRTINRKSRAPAVGRLPPELLLILARAEGGDDLKKLLT